MERISGKTELVGVLATPIRHSNSPRMQNEAFARVGADYVYLAFDIGAEGLEAAVAGMRALGARGFNVSMPNKQLVIKYLDELSPAAEMAGSVNTVVNENGRLIGHNTDGYGFWEALRMNDIDFVGKKATLVGPGGVGTAICVQGALDGLASLSVFSRGGMTYPTGKTTIERIDRETPCDAKLYMMRDEEMFKKQILESDIFINATGVGMGDFKGQSVIADESVFHPGLTVCDVVYAPKKSRLLEQAEAHGCRFLNGTDMMLCQGAKGFQMWTGKDFPMDDIRPMFYED